MVIETCQAEYLLVDSTQSGSQESCKKYPYRILLLQYREILNAVIWKTCL